VDARRLRRFESPSDHSLAAGKRFGVMEDLSLDLTTSAVGACSAKRSFDARKADCFRAADNGGPVGRLMPFSK
jgi:hypothetical protein